MTAEDVSGATRRQFRWSLRALLASTCLAGVACAAIVALGFERFYSPLLALSAFLAIALLLTRNAVLVSSVGCVLSLPLVVVGGEHIRGPLWLLAWESLQHGYPNPVIEIGTLASLPIAALLSSIVVSDSRARFVLSFVGIAGLLGVWAYLALDHFLDGRGFVASLPLLTCSGWRAALGMRRIGRKEP